MPTTHFDHIIIGAGMAGASLASELAPGARVLLVEREAYPGYHATGRSAAFWTESYGGPLVQPLTGASGPWLANPPPEISERSFLAPRGALTIGKAGDVEDVRAFGQEFAALGVAVDMLDRAMLTARIPGLRPDYLIGAYEPDCSDIDVGGLHGAYLSHAKRNGARLLTNADLTAAHYSGGQWQVTAAGQSFTATTLTNAAGAWADPVAAIAGVQPIGITPYRRTLLQVRVDRAVPDDLPLVLGVQGDFYFKPENGRVWLSPHDETASPPCDAAAEEMDVAIAIDRFSQVVDWQVQAVERRWAGLRSFAPDRLPVIGRDPGNPAFFWFAGQGGFGIQTAPAAARLALSLLRDGPPDAMLAGVEAKLYNPARFFR